MAVIMRYCQWVMGLSLLLLGASSFADTIEVVDARGKTLVLDKPVERIIALAPHIVENVYSAGAGDKLIGVVSYSDYPSAAKLLPQVGSFMSVNFEQVLALKPDLVIGWLSGSSTDIASQLERLGLKVYMDEPDTLQSVADSVRTIGRLAGTQPTAEKAAADYLVAIESLAHRYRGASAVSVLYQVWHDPLQTLNSEHLVSDVIRLCGGENSYADAQVLAPKISIESVLARNPDMIVASGMANERPEWLDYWQRYSSLAAVQQNNLYVVPPDIIQRHTLRIAEGARIFCEKIEKVREKRVQGPS
ncbi:MAG TPA: cobalamin-binding protein [Cellvibrionaceae bacterium]